MNQRSSWLRFPSEIRRRELVMKTSEFEKGIMLGRRRRCNVCPTGPDWTGITADDLYTVYLGKSNVISLNMGFEN